MAEEFAVEYPPGRVIRATAPDPPGRYWLSTRQVDEFVTGAVVAGQIPAHQAGYWRGRIMAGGAAGGEAIATLIVLGPAELAASAAPGDEAAVWAAMYGAAAAGPGDSPPGDGHHGPVPSHGPVSVQHAHEHADYAGGSHAHTHRHIGDADHRPREPAHAHSVPVAPVGQPGVAAAAGIAARRAAQLAEDPGGPAGLSDDQLYARLFGPGG